MSQRDTSEEDKQALQTARGITETNPHGYEGFLVKLGIDPSKIDYSGIASASSISDIADANYNRYVNPMNDPNRPGFDPE